MTGFWNSQILVAILLCATVTPLPCGSAEPTYVRPAADEPVASAFSLAQSARALDVSAVWWQDTQKCCHCHASMLYLVARPALEPVVQEDGKVRRFFESLVVERWEQTGLRYDPEAVVVAVPLAIHDSRTTGRLHPATRKALDRMIAVQRPEGNWTLRQANGQRVEVAGERRAFFLGYEQMLFAAIGIAVAPDRYAQTEPAREALRRIRDYTARHPATTLHQKGMLLWAAAHVEGLSDEPQRTQAVKDLFHVQQPDGGWALVDLAAGAPAFEHVAPAVPRQSDGYATGFVIFVLRQAGVPQSDERLQRGIAWLKSHQRESGRWFVPSFNNRPNHVLTNSATAYAILALEACGEVPAPPDK